MFRFLPVVPRPVPTISRTVVSFATVNTDWWSGSTFVGSTHVGGVGGHSTKITEIIIWAISAPVATFTTPRTYNSVLWWLRRLSSGTCICQILGWVSDVFFDLVAPWPIVSALVDPLVSLRSSGSWWFLLGLVTGGACGGPPAHVVGAVGAGPWGLSSVGFEGRLWALLSLSCLCPLRMVFSLLPSSDDDSCCGCVAMLSILGGTNLPCTFLLVMDSSGLYELLPLCSWWASLRFAASLWACGTHLSHGVNVGALFFIPWSTGVCGFSTSKVMGLILFKLNPMSLSSKDLKHENEPEFICGCLLSPCIIICISLVIVLISSHADWVIWSALLCSRSLLLGR